MSRSSAASMRRALPSDGAPLVVLGHKEPDMLVDFRGAVGSGHPYIPLGDSLPAARIAAVVASAGASLTLRGWIENAGSALALLLCHPERSELASAVEGTRPAWYQRGLGERP